MGSPRCAPETVSHPRLGLEGLWCPSGSQAGVGLDLGFELVVGEGEHAAVRVVDEDDLPGPKESLTDDQGPNLVLGDDSASVANHVGVALAQAEQSVGVSTVHPCRRLSPD